MSCMGSPGHGDIQQTTRQMMRQARAEAKVETRAEVRAEAKVEARAEVRAEAKVEARAEARVANKTTVPETMVLLIALKQAEVGLKMSKADADRQSFSHQ